MRKKSASPSSAKGSKSTSSKQKSLDSQAIINKTVALNSSLLAAETTQLESFIKSRSKFLDEEIEKMRLKLHTPSTEVNLKGDKKGSSSDSGSNRNATQDINSNRAERFIDAELHESDRRQQQNRDDRQNNYSDNYSNSGGIDSRKNYESNLLPGQFRIKPVDGKLADIGTEDLRDEYNRDRENYGSREDREGRDYGEREDHRRIKDKRQNADSRDEGYKKNNLGESRGYDQYDTGMMSQNRRNFINPRGRGYDEGKSEINPKYGMNESFEAGNRQRNRFGEDDNDDRNNFDSGTFSAFRSEDKNLSMNLSKEVSAENSHSMKDLFDRIKNGKYVIISRKHFFCFN